MKKKELEKKIDDLEISLTERYDNQCFSLNKMIIDLRFKLTNELNKNMDDVKDSYRIINERNCFIGIFFVVVVIFVLLRPIN